MTPPSAVPLPGLPRVRNSRYNDTGDTPLASCRRIEFAVPHRSIADGSGGLVQGLMRGRLERKLNKYRVAIHGDHRASSRCTNRRRRCVRRSCPLPQRAPAAVNASIRFWASRLPPVVTAIRYQ